MRDRSDQRRRGRARQHRVGVERDDVADAAQPRQIAFGDGERAVVRAADERIEVDELSALALPPHPHAVGGIPSSRPMQQVEGRIARRVAAIIGSVIAVRGVQRANSGDGRFDDRGVALRRARSANRGDR